MITLEKQKNKDFLVLNFTDIHLKDKYLNTNNPRKVIPYHIIDTLVRDVKPDLITVTGDITKSFQYESYRTIADLFESYSIPWTVVWGNHDNEGGDESVEKVESEYLLREHFVYESGDRRLGHGNYVIGITEEGRPVQALIMMDTHSDMEYINNNGEVQRVNARLTDEQILWYRAQVSELKSMGYNESSLLIHIPINAYLEAFSAALKAGVDPYEIKYGDSFSPEIWNESYAGSFGVMHDRITSYPFDDGVFDAILEEDHTKTVLCGHDHKNSFVISHRGVRFAYSLRSGNSSYQRPQALGGTLIRLSSNGVKSVEHLPVSISHLEKTNK